MAKNPLKTLRNKADRAYQQSRDPKTPCEACGVPSQVYHHFFPKSTSSRLRYDMRNAIPLCNGCHLKHHTGNPTIHATVIEKRGMDWYKQLDKDRHEIIKVNKEFYEEAINRLSK
jgi:5-methylcytosine-specific restriction endonuclease McrA